MQQGCKNNSFIIYATLLQIKNMTDFSLSNISYTVLCAGIQLIVMQWQTPLV